MPDYKQLCAELLGSAEELDDLIEGIRLGNYMPDSLTLRPMRAVLARARADLAEPESEWPTDADLHAMAFSYSQPCYEFEYIPFARSVLARWGRPAPAPQPIPVTERLPGSEDCVVISWSELRSPHVWAGKRRLINGPTEIWDWTFVSIPWLEESGEFTHWLPASASVLPAGAIRQSNPST